MEVLMQYFFAAVSDVDLSAFDRLDPIKNSDGLIRLLQSDTKTATLLSGFMRSHRDIGPDLPQQNPLLRQLLKKLMAYKHWDKVQKRVFTFGKMLHRLRDYYTDYVERSYAPGGRQADGTLGRLKATASILDAHGHCDV